MFSKINLSLRKLGYVYIIPIIFLIIGIVTIPDYGVNWDSFVHFSRGQAYLHYYLTGKTNYDNLPKYTNSDCISGNLGLFNKCRDKNDRRSYYQNDYYNYEYYIVNDSGHPPLNDIFAALTNYIFYQKLGIFGDVISHHLFIVLASFSLILVITYFVKQEFGSFPAFVSSTVLASYPIFFSESHFNIKDPPETVFFGLTLIFFYKGIIKTNWKLIIISAITAGLALGTKFNIVFATLIIGPWLFYYLVSNKNFICKIRPLMLSLFLYLPICFGIVYAFWPYLWQNPRNIFNILGYYTQIGIGTPVEMSKYILDGWNLYPIYWIIVTTPIPVLILTLLGLIFFLYSKKNNKFSILLFVLLWFMVPILRTSWPNAGIYGGVRQIMEYVPALAILSGIGTYFVIKMGKKFIPKFTSVFSVVIICGLIFSTYEMIKIHPNENIYFNQLVGGFGGAVKKNIPYWGNTFGSVYLQGVKWINENAEKGAKVALPVGVMSNIPNIMFRSDIDFSKPFWTGPIRGGEYGIEMYFEWPVKYWYSFQYYDKYLEPTYIYFVDNIPILKVWKNDLEHTRSEFKKDIVYQPKSIVIDKNSLNSQLLIDLGKEIYLTKFTIKHSNNNCQKQKLGYIALSSDKTNWKQEVEPITIPQVAPGVNEKIIDWSEDNFVFLFAGKKARYILLDPQMDNSCYLKNYQIEVKGFSILP